MTSARELYQLQELDTQLDSRRTRLAQVEKLIGDAQALRALNERLDKKRSDLANLNREQKALELDSQELRDKIAKVNSSLYGGTVKSVKELGGLQADLEQTRRFLKEKEDQVLALMSVTESLEADAQKEAEEYAKAEAEWKKEQESLKKVHQEALAELTALENQRAELTKDMDRPSLTLYEGLRTSRQGLAVARVEGGMCKGCRISLPTTQLQKARVGNPLVRCNSCGRILYVS